MSVSEVPSMVRPAGSVEGEPALPELTMTPEMEKRVDALEARIAKAERFVNQSLAELGQSLLSEMAKIMGHKMEGKFMLPDLDLLKRKAVKEESVTEKREVIAYGGVGEAYYHHELKLESEKMSDALATIGENHREKREERAGNDELSTEKPQASKSSTMAECGLSQMPTQSPSSNLSGPLHELPPKLLKETPPPHELPPKPPDTGSRSVATSMTKPSLPKIPAFDHGLNNNKTSGSNNNPGPNKNGFGFGPTRESQNKGGPSNGSPNSNSTKPNRDDERKLNGDRGSGIKHLPYSELMDRKARGLCFRCGEKFHPLHQCAEKQLRLLILGDDGDENAGEVLAIEADESAEEEEESRFCWSFTTILIPMNSGHLRRPLLMPQWLLPEEKDGEEEGSGYCKVMGLC